MHHPSRAAFSLVELSIVLVIFGLLVGGIMAGQSLVRASELRSVTADISKYTASIMSFRDKYFGLPGDINNATMIWGKDATNCNGNTGTAATPGTCNGNSDLYISNGGPGAEGYRAWQQLSLAGLIEGNYLGTITSGATLATPGIDIPASKMPGGGYTLVALSQNPSINNELGYSDLPDVRLNMMFFGAKTAAWANGYMLKPEEAWNLDSKMDDGRPALGKVRAGRGVQTTCQSATDSTAIYNLATTSVQCFMGFLF